MTAWRTLAKASLCAARVYHGFVRWVRPWSGVMVLTYHGVRAATATREGTSEELHVRIETLNEHLQVIRTLATPISLDIWRRARQGSPLPPRAVLVTFDDGYRSFLIHGLPLLERYDVPAVVFACTGAAYRGELLWFDALERHGRASDIERAKSLSYPDWRALVEACRHRAAEDDERAVMTPEELARLAGHPLIEIGGHTVEHPILARAPVSVQQREIAGSIFTLQEWTGRCVRAFAYPNGRPTLDFTPDTTAIVREMALDHAFSTEPRMAVLEDRYTCPRFTMLDSISAAQLAHNLAIAWERGVP